MPEHDPDLGGRGRHRLPGSDEERHLPPALVVDFQPQRHIGLRAGAAADTGHVLVALVLRADTPARVRVRDRAQDGDLGIPQGGGIRPLGCLHRDQGQDLQEVVLHHVPQCPHHVVEGPAVVDAEVLGEGDLHAFNVLAVPDRCQQRVGEAQVGQVQHRLLAEEVVDPQDLLLLQQAVQPLVQVPGRGGIVAEGLLDQDVGVPGEPCALQLADDIGEQGRRDLQVEQRTACSLEPLTEVLVELGVGEVPVQVVHAGRETLQRLLVNLLFDRLDGFAHRLPQLVYGPFLTGDPDDRTVQTVRGLQPVQSGKRHLVREVTGDAEYHQDVALLLGSVGHQGLPFMLHGVGRR